MTRCVSRVHGMDGMDATEVMGGRALCRQSCASVAQNFGDKNELSKDLCISAVLRLAGRVCLPA